MAVSPQVLKMISDPTAGKLGDIAQTYLKSKQVGIENKLTDEKMQLAKDKATADAQQTELDNMYKSNTDKRATEDAAREAQTQQVEMADKGSQAMGAYSTAVLKAIEDNPELVTDEAKFAEVQKSIYDSFPDGYKQFIPEDTQSVEEIRRGLTNANSIQSRLNPVTPKTTFEMGSIQNVKTGQVISRPKDDPYLAEMVGTNEWVKYSPSQGGTTSDITKKTKGKLQDDQLLAAQMQDDIAALDTMWNDFGKGKMDWVSQGGDAATRVMEKLGLPITKGQEISSGNREKMKGRTKQLQTAWRLHVTGSQAGKWEIKDIASQPLNMEDTNSQWKVKLPAWKDKADRIAVRAKLAQSQGFNHSGLVKLSDGREMPMWTNPDTGETKAITDFGALGDIPSMKEYMAAELQKRYPNVDAMSKTEQKAAIEQVKQQANQLGYR